MNEEIANFVYDQLAGEQNGHMAKIPNNPVMHSLLGAYGAQDSKLAFARFLFDVATFLGDESARSIEEDAINNAAEAVQGYIEEKGEKIGSEFAVSVIKHSTKRRW